MNCGPLVEILCRVTEWRLELVRTRTAGALEEFTSTKPKLTEVEETVTEASTGIANNDIKPNKRVTSRHTGSVLFMGGPLIYLGAGRNGAKVLSNRARNADYALRVFAETRKRYWWLVQIMGS